MKEIKSSAMFENLKPDEEQKNRIYERIKEEYRENGGHRMSVVSDKPFRHGVLAIPAAACLTAFIAAAALFNMKADNTHEVIPSSPSVTESEDVQEQQRIYREISLSGERSYTAKPYTQIWNGEFGLQREEGKYSITADEYRLHTEAENIKTGEVMEFLNSTGNPIDACSIECRDGKIYVLGYDNSGLFGMYIYGKGNNIPEKVVAESDNYDHIPFSFVFSGDDMYVLFAGSSGGFAAAGDDTSCALVKYTTEGELVSEQSITQKTGTTYIYGSIMTTPSGNIAVPYYIANDLYRISETELNTSSDISDKRVLALDIYDSEMNYQKSTVKAVSYTSWIKSGYLAETDESGNVKLSAPDENGELVTVRTYTPEDAEIVRTVCPPGGDYPVLIYKETDEGGIGMFGLSPDSDEPVPICGSGNINYTNMTECVFESNDGLWAVRRYTDTCCTAAAESAPGKPVYRLSFNNEQRVIKVNDGNSQYPYTVDTAMMVTELFCTGDGEILVTGLETDVDGQLEKKVMKKLDMKERCLVPYSASVEDAHARRHFAGTGKYQYYYICDTGFYGVTAEGENPVRLIDMNKVYFDINWKAAGYTWSGEIKKYIEGVAADKKGNIYMQSYDGHIYELIPSDR